ncbi:MAG: type II secretion system protein GspL [Undibacterium sp.]|nr:type II secretion system protein GspL [Undibacterium sp.]
MANTLYILLPSKAMARQLPDWVTHPRPFGLVSDEGGIVQQGQQTLASLKDLAINARQVVLLLAASDVSLISVKVPPMSAAKLKVALPNLIEDQLLDDPSELILLSNPAIEGLCVIAAVSRTWMELLHAQMQVLHAKKLIAYSISMTMQTRSEAMIALIDPDELVTELAFRFEGSTGAGLTLNHNINVDSQAAVAQQVLQALNLFSAESELEVYLPVQYLETYQQAAVSDPALTTRMHFQPMDWKVRIAGLSPSSIDLMSSVSHDNQTSFDWGKWRWPLGLAAATVIMNLAGLNFQWLSMKREAQALNDSLVQTYRTSFPKESVILDPLAQMQQKINLSKKIAGQSTPDDFLVLAAQFGQVWDAAMAGKQPVASVVSMEYREHSLFVKTKSSGLLPLEQLRAGLQEHVLTLVSSTDGILQVRPGRGDRK